MDKEIKIQIEEAIDETIKKVDGDLKEWFLNHLVEPQKVKLSIDIDGHKQKDFVMITDHNNVKDSSYRIVFDPDTNNFGLECTLESGVRWYMGSYESLYNALTSM